MHGDDTGRPPGCWTGLCPQKVVMATARDIMSGGAECVGENDTWVDAARKMRDLDVGALPICGEDNRLKGMLTSSRSSPADFA